jgi:hypothetical protein
LQLTAACARSTAVRLVCTATRGPHLNPQRCRGRTAALQDCARRGW